MSRALFIALVAVVGSLLTVPTSSVAASTVTTRDATVRFDYDGATRLARAASTNSRPQRSDSVPEVRSTGGRSRACASLQQNRFATED
jgi:YD repeat-containing protein